MIKKMHDLGVRSDYAYIAGIASVGLTYISYLTSRARKGSDKAQADRWGIFVATWAPTMFALGTALRLEEGK
ncbi:hypothetical protein [Microlunatus soli]|uniref:Uncharacterized protein n=1 Tax=Microlunatus soli TaxID=630515 RepID=A0A1H1N2M3_9ACTN|nr:hypothetical protein [Microlunatus soli]SDR93140.1 hypothetical protein SAMN04489812_0351 [Microlunatus soli]